MKKIIVVALDPRACQFYADEVRSVFSEVALVESRSVRDGTAMGILPRADLYVVSTDAYGSAEEVAKHVPIDGQTMAISVSYKNSALKRLQAIPKGTKALYVNMTETMAREAIAQLQQLGINHVKFIPFYPGAVLKEDITLAVTPDEARYVPDGITEVMNLNHRSCTSGMMIEIAIRLGVENIMETEGFKRYVEEMSTNDYSFDQMYNRSIRLESQFHILMEILDEGIVGVNESGKIFACNQKAEEILRVERKLVIGKGGEEVFAYIPFHQCLEEKEEISEKIVKLNGINISIKVVPVMRNQECTGAFATVQRFNDVEKKQNELRSQIMHKGHCARYTFDDIVGVSEAVQKTKEISAKMSRTESPVLIIGETGTGKELLAHAVHHASKRKDGPFIAINVAAMPENLLESELFGYEEGAFTGAKKGGKIGLFEFAHKGTLFLDEVEGMSPLLQIKLLRVLQEREIMRIGGTQIIKIDVRIIAATNESLEKKVEDGTFRKDLYYRLNTLPVMVPPLRERGDDIFLLLNQFKEELHSSYELSEEVKRFFISYLWPGNIRELRNVAEYLDYTGVYRIRMEDLPPTIARNRIKLEDTGAPGIRMRPDVDERAETQVGAKAGVRTDAGLELYWFLLKALYEAYEANESLGREKLLLLTHEHHILSSQKSIRDTLKKLESEGLVVISKGRGGSRITAEGYNKWLTGGYGNQKKQ